MKRILSFLCMLAMLLSVVNPAAFAAEETAGTETIVLEADASNVTVNRDTIIDLNGHNLDGVTVTGGTLYCMDAQTADYTVADGVYGHLTNVTGNVEAAEGYLQVGDSFHAVNLDIYAMTLRAADVGVYYKSNFAADEVVAEQVESFGVALSVVTAPNADNLDTYCGYSVFTGFEAGEGANATGTSTLLKGIMKAANGDNKNAKNAAMPIYGSAYIKTAEGYVFGETVKRSLQEQVEAINGVWDDLSYSQKAPILEMLETFAFVKESWNIAKLEGVLIPGIDSEIEMPISVNAENGVVAENTTVSGSNAAVTVPAGTQLAAGTNGLTLTVTPKESSDTDLTPGKSEVLLPMDVHVDGVEATNTAPVLITLKACLPAGLNDGNVRLYHVENGQTVEMTRVAAPVNHNEFSYDPLTGDVVLAMANFSEISMLADANNTWDGSSATSFNGGDGTENNPYQIANANQLAYFRDQVDTGVNYAGQFVKLGADINLNGVNFDPIGWGYDYDGYTPNGKTFNGIFDGGNHTISGLYQNGWELGYSYCMAGGGLFASVVDATIQNLTINNANIVMECVDMGILVGLSQGTCTYKNITIQNSKIANYQRATGGVVGEVSPEYDADKKVLDSEHTFEKITVAPTVVVGSLWGDFDAPVGGVIGGRWDDDNRTEVIMKEVKVAARLDVYNDVTSAYQWHAYRRAGMLIGNTDTPAANGKQAQVATADFLKCENVTVYYGDWADYHYCQFTNELNPGRNYPWVRVEAGENCSAYSNPRYGQPTDLNGKTVVDENHTHQDGDQCTMLITFGQLYGGGQGVYGQSEHDGVSTDVYTITFMYDGQLLNVQYVTDNTKTVTIDQYDNDAMGILQPSLGTERKFAGWVNAGSTKVTEIAPGNKKNIVLYPSFEDLYTARFVDQQGNILATGTFTKGNGEDIKKLAESVDTPILEDCVFDYWEVHVTDENGKTTQSVKLDAYTFAEETDITIYPIYTYEGNVSLIPIDSDGDGVTNYYRVVGSNIPKEATDIVIPDYVNGIAVEEVYTGAFADGKLRDVYVPHTVKTIKANAFAKNGTEFPQIQIIYDGTKDEWVNLIKESGWDDNIGSNSDIICLREKEEGHYNQSGSNGFFGWGANVDWQWQEGYPDWYPRTESNA